MGGIEVRERMLSAAFYTRRYSFPALKLKHELASSNPTSSHSRFSFCKYAEPEETKEDEQKEKDWIENRKQVRLRGNFRHNDSQARQLIRVAWRN